MPLELRGASPRISGAVADPIIDERLTATGQLMNIGGPEEFGKSIDEQRAKVAAYAKELGVRPMQ